MKWENASLTLPPEGKYVVKAKSVFKEVKHINTFECNVSYTKKEDGTIKQHWSCGNQIVIQWLNEKE